jgi:hypothetical protein
MEIESQPIPGQGVLTVPMGHLELEPEHILPAAKRQYSSNSLLYYLEADIFIEDLRAVFRLRSFVVTCRRLLTQVHITLR